MLIKNKHQWRFSILALVMTLALFACSDDQHLHDLSHYIDGLKKAITKHQRKNVIADIELPVPVHFQPPAKQRDPFIDEQSSFSGSGTSNDPMTAFPIKQFNFEGTVVRNNQTWAIIKAPDNKIYQATIKDRIGNQYGRIVEIYPDRIKVEEAVPQQESGGTGPGVIKRIVTLPIKGEN